MGLPAVTVSAERLVRRFLSINFCHSFFLGALLALLFSEQAPLGGHLLDLLVGSLHLLYAYVGSSCLKKLEGPELGLQRAPQHELFVFEDVLMYLWELYFKLFKLFQ